MVDEARLEETEGGLEPVGEGWFVVNVADTAWYRNDVFGASCPFEAARNDGARFAEYGINIHVVWPGQPNCMYHGEAAQEDFLVLAGECLLLIEGEERPLKAWDFVHFPKWTEHVIVGAGSAPCAILMVGSRADERVTYPVSELAAKHGAGVERETDQPSEAYARFPQWRRERVDDQGLPWN
jgi:uncharacterized cupin superfamily protein